jgi:hypothetical protein
MSYILDALQKAEADQDPDARASLAIAQHARDRQRLIGYGVIAALLVNALILVWLFFPEPGESPTAGAIPTGTSATPAPSGASENHPKPVEAAPDRVEPADTGTVALRIPQPAPAPQPAVRPTESTAQSVTPVRTPTPRATARSSPAAPRPVTLAGLPSELRSRFPELRFSMHIHGDEPGLSAVVINGRRLVEGDSIEGLTVHRITESGAVFRYEGYLVDVPVLDSWD